MGTKTIAHKLENANEAHRWWKWEPTKQMLSDQLSMTGDIQGRVFSIATQLGIQNTAT